MAYHAHYANKELLIVLAARSSYGRLRASARSSRERSSASRSGRMAHILALTITVSIAAVTTTGPLGRVKRRCEVGR